jgi:small-conductance mechanosensitive channel/CRP-like cAMP-binding protein
MRLQAEIAAAPTMANETSLHTVAALLGSMALLMAGVLYVRRPDDRKSLRNTLGLALLGGFGVLLAQLLRGRGIEVAADFLREASLILAGLALIRLTGQFLFRVVLPLARFSPPRILEDLVVMAAYVVWGLVRMRLAGLDLSGIVATSAVITAIVAFSVQDTLGNILGGLALELDSGFEIGDWIRVDDVAGRVVDIRWRSVSIETRNWETVIVPNSHMVRSKVVVLGRRSGHPVQLRRWVWFGVPLSAVPARVVSVVEAALKSATITNVAAEPAANCVLMEFDRGYARYAVRYWLTNIERDDPTDSAVREHVLAALQRAGMRIAVPEGQVHLVTEDKVHADEVAEREIRRRLDAVRSIDLFKELTDEERRRVASRLEPAPFAAGDLITRQGAVAHWLYVLAEGTATVALDAESGQRHEVAQLDAPTVFGEMGLLTGEPRHATVVARSGCECYRLRKAAFEEILLKRPELAERMSRILAQRQNNLDAKHRDLSSRPSGRNGAPRMSEEILAEIKRFFGIAGG